MKKTFRIVFRTFLSFIGAVLLYILAAFGLSRISIEAEENTEKVIPIYISTNGIHTDLIVPVKNEVYNWQNEILFSHTLSNDTNAQFLAFGIGDRGFYLDTKTWGDLTIATTCNAAFGLGTSVIHTRFYRSLTESETCKKILISAKQYQALVNYINSFFRRDEKYRLIHIERNYGQDDTFYEAKGKCHLLHTCNTWVNNGLKVAGQKACLWTPYDKGIFYHYQ